MNYGRNLLENWYLDKNIHYLNHGSFGATPKRVIEEGRRIEEEMETELITFFMEKYPDYYLRSIKSVSKFLNLTPSNVALIENATSGVNTVLNNLETKIDKDDEVLVLSHVYPAVKITLDNFAKRTSCKLNVIEIPFPTTGEEILSLVHKSINDNTKIAIFDHISSATGLVFPVKELINICNKFEIITIVDGAHAPGMIAPDIECLGCDFYTGNMHKWSFAQKGCAILWTAPKWHGEIHPLTISHNYNKSYVDEFSWVGTRNPVSWFSLPEAVKFYNEYGGAAIRNYNKKLVIEAGELLKDSLGLNFSINPDMTGSILTMPLPKTFSANNETAQRLHKELLDNYNIELMIVTFNNKLYFRISSQIYNELSDYEHLAESLTKMCF